MGIVRMPYFCSNIPRKIFFSALVGEFLRIARATLRVSDFVPKGIDLVNRMVNQGGDRKSIEHFLLKIIRRHPDSFSHFRLRPEDLIQSVNTTMNSSFPCFDGSPQVGEHSLNEDTTV